MTEWTDNAKCLVRADHATFAFLTASHTDGKLFGVAAKKVTVSMDVGTHELAERAARREGLSFSAWLSRAARREAVRLGAAPAPATSPDGRDPALADALADEAELAAAEEDLRNTG